MKGHLMKRGTDKCKYSGGFGITKTPLNPAKTHFEVIAGAFFLKCKCPTAKAGGASGSRAHPTFSACPAGQGRLQHTDGMFCPPLTRLKADFNIPGGMLGFKI